MYLLPPCYWTGVGSGVRAPPTGIPRTGRPDPRFAPFLYPDLVHVRPAHASRAHRKLRDASDGLAKLRSLLTRAPTRSIPFR